MVVAESNDLESLGLDEETMKEIRAMADDSSSSH